MLYLGCDAEHSTHNQIGVAFANSLRGPWHRYPDPILRYTDAPEAGVVGEYYAWPVYRFWGVGQPAAVSLDRRGRVLLFYSRGEGVFGEEMAELDMSDMDRGPILTQRVRVPTEGLRRNDGKPLRALVNVGVALDEGRDRLYMVREELPPSDGRLPNFIADYVQVCATSWSALRKGAGSWKILGEVDAERTGWPRNHNATIVKDAWGRVQAGRELTLAVSVAEAYDVLPPEFGWLWTYRVALVSFALKR